MQHTHLLPCLALAFCAGCSPSAWTAASSFMVGYSIGQSTTQPPAQTPSHDDAPSIGVVRVPVGAPQAVDMNRPVIPAAPERSFDAGRAYAAIDRVDLGPCRARGLAIGYGHALMTYSPDGSVANVALELPEPSSRDATWCADQVFRTARVSPFDGQQTATVRRGFYIAPVQAQPEQAAK